MSELYQLIFYPLWKTKLRDVDFFFAHMFLKLSLPFPMDQCSTWAVDPKEEAPGGPAVSAFFQAGGRGPCSALLVFFSPLVFLPFVVLLHFFHFFLFFISSFFVHF